MTTEKYCIRKNTKSNNPEAKGELKRVYETYKEASDNCKDGYYVCEYKEPKL